MSVCFDHISHPPASAISASGLSSLTAASQDRPASTTTCYIGITRNDTVIILSVVIIVTSSCSIRHVVLFTSSAPQNGQPDTTMASPAPSSASSTDAFVALALAGAAASGSQSDRPSASLHAVAAQSSGQRLHNALIACFHVAHNAVGPHRYTYDIHLTYHTSKYLRKRSYIY